MKLLTKKEKTKSDIVLAVDIRESELGDCIKTEQMQVESASCLVCLYFSGLSRSHLNLRLVVSSPACPWCFWFHLSPGLDWSLVFRRQVHGDHQH